ncbi:hypothetical protein C8Q72DRAFT_934285, partial [Fomitopsis betulina]
AAVVPRQKTRGELEEAAEKIRKGAQSVIEKQMNMKAGSERFGCAVAAASCKTNSAKWSYDGIRPDPEVFGMPNGPGRLTSFKMNKSPKSEFKDLVGSFEGHVRCIFDYSFVPVCMLLRGMGIGSIR